MLSAFASDFYTVDAVPNPRLENTSFHVSDPASLLTHDTVSYLNENLLSSKGHRYTVSCGSTSISWRQ